MTRRARPHLPDDVAHVARLARLELTADELERYTEQLASVLDHSATSTPSTSTASRR